MGSSVRAEDKASFTWLQTKAAPETETYEEKKVKLQKAMGENLGEASADPTTEQRRQHLMA